MIIFTRKDVFKRPLILKNNRIEGTAFWYYKKYLKDPKNNIDMLRYCTSCSFYK